MKTRLHVFGMAIAAASLMALSACGGDNDNTSGGGTNPTNTVAPAATATKTNTQVSVATATHTQVAVATPTNTTGAVPTPTNTTGVVATATNTTGVVNTPTPTATTGGVQGVCGNNAIEGDEQCDDGNTVGGDGCSANCTNETRQTCTFDPDRTTSLVQTGIFAIPLSLTGNQVLTSGAPRNSDSQKLVPVVIKASDVHFDPVQVPGLVCACVRGIAKDEFGPGNSGVGTASCSANGLQNIDYLITVDHDTHLETPDPDPSCANGTVEDGSSAHPHTGACNSNPATANSGGAAGVGANQIMSNSAISLISDGGACTTDGSGDPALYGPDGSACTDDDPGQATPNTTITTSGTAGAKILNANHVLGTTIGVGETCGASDCVTQQTGSPIDCTTTPPSIGGSSQASAFVQLDAAQIGDDVVSSLFACKQQ
ncbi:MAG TPA: myxococcus cysteine-rich repeat containing protein [Candidatus Binatia bacterium]|nr:myxococcus cysteine-rich repeat containing protein [Candidatus Binatia bacterium]